MPKDLNDAIDSIFRGVVFIFYNYFYSLARIAARPALGGFELVRRLRLSSTDQVRPYVFIFLSFFACLAVPRYIARISHFHKGDDFPRSSEHATALQNAYSKALQMFDPKSVLAITLACIAMSVVVDGLISLFVVALTRKGVARTSTKSALLYVAGLQPILLTLAIVFVFFNFRGWAWSTLNPNDQSQFASTFRDIFDAATNLESGWDLFISLTIFAAGVGIFIYGLFQPAHLFFALLKRPRPGLLKIRATPLLIAVIAIAAAVAAFANYQGGLMLSERIQPAEWEQPKVSDVSCTLNDDNRVRATATISNPSGEPLSIEPENVELELAIMLEKDQAEARIKAATPQVQKRLMKLKDNEQKSFQYFKETTITNSSQGSGKPIYMISPGQAIWIEALAKNPAKPFEFGGENLLYCGLSLPDVDVDPIRAYAMVGRDGHREALTADALKPPAEQPKK